MIQQMLLPYVLALILNDKNEVLLEYRKNTSWFSDHYGLVGGSIDANESATTALIREIAEEVGVTVNPKSIEFVHVMHFKGTNVPCVAFFYRVRSWEGIIKNLEPNKHDHLKWFPLDKLPDNIIPRHRKALQLIVQGSIYSEDNWQNS